MKKQDILKMTGLSEEEFYKKYPTQESFTQAYGAGGKIGIKASISKMIKNRSDEEKGYVDYDDYMAGKYADGGVTYNQYMKGMYEAGGPTTPMVGPEMYAQGGYAFPQATGDIFDMMGLSQINQYMYGGGIQSYGKGSGIHIDPSKRGTFTAAAKKHGKSVQAFASQVLANKGNYSPAMVKKANFARNAAKWKHEDGGDIQDIISTANRYDNWLNLPERPMYQSGGSVNNQITAANQYDNWMNVPKYGLGDIIPGIGDAVLGTVDTGLSIFGGQDIIGDKQYSDTGLGRTIKDASHYTSAAAESLVPTVVSVIPGIGQLVSSGLNVLQTGVDALTPDDMERLQSESGRNAMYLGMGLDAAGAITSLGTGAAKAANTGAKMAKAVKTLDTVNKIVKGASAAKNIYDTATSDNASIGDWLGAAAGAAGAASGAMNTSDLSKGLSTASKIAKMGQTGYNIGERASKTGTFDIGSSLGLASDITDMAAGKPTKAGTFMDLAGLGASTYQAAKSGASPFAVGTNALNKGLAMAPRIKNTFSKDNPTQTSSGATTMGDMTDYTNMLSGNIEYSKHGGYTGMNNFSKFANGGTVMGNIERNELTIVPGQYGAGGSPKVVADYSNFPSHPADGSLDPEATIPLPYNEENPYFIIPKKYRNKALRADKLEMEGLMNKISFQKQKKEEAEFQKASTAYERFVNKYGKTLGMDAEPSYVGKMGGAVKYVNGGPPLAPGPRDVGFETYYDLDAPLAGTGTVLAPDAADMEQVPPMAYSPNMFFDITKYGGTPPDNAASEGFYGIPYDLAYRGPKGKEGKSKKDKEDTWLNRNAETLATVGMMSPAAYNLAMGLFSKPQKMDTRSGNIQRVTFDPVSADAAKAVARQTAAGERYAARRGAGSSSQFLSYLTQNANRRIMAEAQIQEAIDRANQEIRMKEALANMDVDKYNKEAEMKRQIFNMQSEAARRAMIAEGMSNVGAIADKLRQSEIYKKRVYPNMLAGSAYTLNPDGTLTIVPKKD